MNAYASAASEIIGAVFGGLWYRVTGVSIALVLSFGLSAAGGICILEYGEIMPNFMPLLVCMARTGIAAAFNIVYYGNSHLFPDYFSSSAMSICNLIARICVIAAPMVSELPGKTPMVIYTAACVGGIVFSVLLREIKTV